MCGCRAGPTTHAARVPPSGGPPVSVTATMRRAAWCACHVTLPRSVRFSLGQRILIPHAFFFFGLPPTTLPFQNPPRFEASASPSVRLHTLPDAVAWGCCTVAACLTWVAGEIVNLGPCYPSCLALNWTHVYSVSAMQSAHERAPLSSHRTPLLLLLQGRYVACHLRRLDASRFIPLKGIRQRKGIRDRGRKRTGVSSAGRMLLHVPHRNE